MAERLEGVDLDDADEVWKKLTPEERSEFERMCATGNIESLVPAYVPWWDVPDATKVELVKDITEVDPKKDPENAEDDKSDVVARPKVDRSSIASLNSLIGDRAPSDLIKFSLLNVIYAYAYALKYFAGYDPENSQDFIRLTFDISANLRDGHNFSSADLAVESAASAANQVTVNH